MVMARTKLVVDAHHMRACSCIRRRSPKAAGWATRRRPWVFYRTKNQRPANECRLAE